MNKSNTVQFVYFTITYLRTLRNIMSHNLCVLAVIRVKKTAKLALKDLDFSSGYTKIDIDNKFAL